MKRKGFDERRDQQIANDYTVNHMACSKCGASTERETLVEYGAQCGPCFTRYVTGGKPNPPMPSREQMGRTLLALKSAMSLLSAPAGKGWAHKLREREERGEEISRIQKQAWRTALREEWRA